MQQDIWKQRLKLLLIAGLLVPLAMAVFGFLLGEVADTNVRARLTWPDWTAAAIGGATGICSLLLVAGLFKTHKAFERALRRSGTRVGEQALQVAGYPVMLIVVTAAGIGEELLFRGGLQPLIGVVPAALLFGVSHGGWRRDMWAYAVAASLSGTLFGLSYHVTSSLWVPIIAHALHNILTTVMLGKRIDVSWEGSFPRVRLLREEPQSDDEEIREVDLSRGSRDVVPGSDQLPEYGPPAPREVPGHHEDRFDRQGEG